MMFRVVLTQIEGPSSFLPGVARISKLQLVEPGIGTVSAVMQPLGLNDLHEKRDSVS